MVEPDPVEPDEPVEPVEPDEPSEDAMPMPMRLSQWRKTSFTGAFVAGALLGLQEVFEDTRPPEIVMVADAAGEPDDGIELDLDPYDPAESWAYVRPDDDPGSGHGNRP